MTNLLTGHHSGLSRERAAIAVEVHGEGNPTYRPTPPPTRRPIA